MNVKAKSDVKPDFGFGETGQAESFHIGIWFESIHV